MKTHGLRRSLAYKRWADMKQRCNNPNFDDACNYSDIDIVYQPSWEYFENFYADMGDCPPGLQLDRINNNGNYTKENCRWTTELINIRNSNVAKLTVEKVRLIKGLLRSINPKISRNKACTLIAPLFQVKRKAIYNIDAGLNWRDVL